MPTPVLVRNRQPGPTVFAIDHNQSYEWAGAGDPNGEDLQAVTSELLDNVQFARAVQRGILIVEDADDQVLATLQNQAERWRVRQEKAERAAMDNIAARPDEDMIQVPCLAPGCTQTTVVKLKTRNDRPALCARHTSLTTSFVLTVDPESDDGSGRPLQRWVHVPTPQR